jgi:TolB protein
MFSETFSSLKTLFVSCFLMISINTFSQKVGIFEGQSDIGKVLNHGSGTYNSSSDEYFISGSGANIWFTNDEFHFVWKKLRGNFILQARGKFVGKGVEEHRKFGVMIRQSLDSSASMVAATVHGNGLTSLQYRNLPHTNVEEKQMKVSAPDVVQLERRGSQFIMSVAHFGEPFSTEEITDIDINDDVYVGLFVCAHNKKLVEKVAFDNVRLTIPVDSNYTPYRDYIGSQIETLDVFSGKRKILYTSPESLQAPNWSHDGKNLIYNSKGLMYRFDLQTKKPGLINTGFVKNNNNDHVISFDGKMLGLSSASGDPKFGSMIYTVSVDGGTPKQITPTGPSYLHGWSPDGKWLTFTGQRNNEFDIYKVPSNGGDEIRLTTTPGLDDGSEFSPDGKYIYFNSVRSGTMQIWRMKPDGSEAEQLTNDEFNNWFPHVSPDGKWIAFLSFMNDVKPDDHPFYKHVYLRLMPFNGGSPKVIAYVYGGQGSINTPSWSPDSKKIAFVSNTKVSE